MFFIHLLKALAYEIESPFIPGIILTKSNGIKEYEIKDSPMKEYKNKDHNISSNRELDSMSSRHTPVLRTIVITRGITPISKPLRQPRGIDFKGSPFFNEREPFNHDYPSNQSYFPFYYDHIPMSNRTVSSRSLEDIVKGKNGTLPTSSNGVVVFKILLLLIFVLIAGLIGFYFGKLQESKNYVRVGIPHSN